MRLEWTVSASRITLTAERIEFLTSGPWTTSPQGFPHIQETWTGSFFGNVLGDRAGTPAGQGYSPQGAWPPISSATTEKKEIGAMLSIPSQRDYIRPNPHNKERQGPLLPAQDLPGFLWLHRLPFLPGTQAGPGYSVVWQWPWLRDYENLSWLFSHLCYRFFFFSLLNNA